MWCGHIKVRLEHGLFSHGLRGHDNLGVHGGDYDDINCIIEGNVPWEIKIVAVNQSRRYNTTMYRVSQQTLWKFWNIGCSRKKENLYLFKKQLLAVVGIRETQESANWLTASLGFTNYFFIRSIWWSLSVQLQHFSHGDDDVIRAFNTNIRSLSKHLQR